MLQVGYISGTLSVETHRERISHYQAYKDELNFEGIDFPVTIDKITKFEKQNPGISIIMIGCEETKEEVILIPIKIPGKNFQNMSVYSTRLKESKDIMLG